jgi:hypothetical protein
MAHIINFIAAGALLVSAPCAFGQTTGQAERNQNGRSTSLASGATVKAALSRTLDSKKSKSGDLVTAQTTEAVKVDGKTALPSGTKLVGHVVRASARAKGDSDSTLTVQFDHAIRKDGSEMPLQVQLQAIASQQGARPVNGDDLQPLGNIEGGAAEAGAAGNRGTVGGVGSTVGGAASGAASTVPRTIDQSGSVSSTTEATTGTSGQVAGGVTSSGELRPTSRGVYGLSGLTLNSNGTNASEGAVITSSGTSVHLDSGTHLLLVAQSATSAAAAAQR